MRTNLKSQISNPSTLCRLLAVALALVVATYGVRVASAAQDTLTGAFEGTVTDGRTGQPIARARVEFVNQQTGVSVSKLSDSQGRFFQGLLPPGTYTIRATAPGFEPGETVQRLNAMRTGEVVPVPITLDPSPSATLTPTPTPAPLPAQTPGPGSTTTQPANVATPQPTPASVAANPAPTPRLTAAQTDVRGSVNAKDSRRGGAFTDVEVQSLLLGGVTLTRTFDELALYLPDVALPPQTLGGGSGPGVGAGVGTSGQFSANGLRSRANNFTVDGSDNNDEDIGVRRQGFFSLVPQPVESHSGVSGHHAARARAVRPQRRRAGQRHLALGRERDTRHGLRPLQFEPAQRAQLLRHGLRQRRLARHGGQPSGRRRALFQLQPAGAQVRARRRPARHGTQRERGEDSFTLGQGGFVLGGPVVARKVFYFVSAEGQLLNASKEASFAVPTIAERGAFDSGADGLFFNRFRNEPEFAFPTTSGGDAVFSLFPFPNNPQGVYGANTLTQQLPAGARGVILSGKLDYDFRLGERAQSLTGRYNFTNDRRDIPVTGGALFSTLRPRVRTQNLSLFFNSELSGPAARTLLFNQLRLSYGRTRLRFDEVRDRGHMIDSEDFPEVPFLLNARVLENLTLPSFNAATNSITANTGPVFYRDAGTVEDRLGPLGQVVVAGFSPVGVDVFHFPQKRVNNTYQFADQMTLKRGSHTFIFGTDNRRTELNSILPRNFRPLLSFQGAPVLAAGVGGLSITNDFIEPSTLAAASAASGFFQTLTRGDDSGINLRFYQLGFYFQDDWRVRPNLSLSLGLRYETNTPAREVRGRIEGTFPASMHAPVPGLDTFIGGRARIHEPDRNNFAPRLGLSYAPHWFGEPGATRVRIGYGRFNDQVLGAVISQSRNVFPTFVTVNTAGGFGNLLFPLLPLGLLNPSNPNLGLVAPGTLNLLNPNVPLPEHLGRINLLASAGGVLAGASGVEATLPARRQEAPVAHHYALTFEQRFGRDTFLSVAYVGTQARNLPRLSTPNLGTNAVSLLRSFDINTEGAGRFQPQFFGIAIQPGTTIGGGRDGQAQSFVGGRPVSNVGGVEVFANTATSRYDALQLELRGRLRSRLLYRAGYTFSKTVDDVSDVFDLAGASALPQNSLTHAGERAPSNFDARHRFAYHAVYDFPRFERRAARLVFKGMQVAGTAQFQTGQPFTVNSIFDVNLDGNLTDRLDNTDGIVVTGDRRQPLRLTTSDLASLRAPVGQDGQVGRNTFRAGSYLDMNLALVKTVRLDESRSLVFRTEIFNFLDRANFGVPVRHLEAPGFGQATSTLTPGRRLQFHLKFSF